MKNMNNSGRSDCTIMKIEILADSDTLNNFSINNGGRFTWTKVLKLRSEVTEQKKINIRELCSEVTERKITKFVSC
jgi:hypothetical protein